MSHSFHTNLLRLLEEIAVRWDISARKRKLIFGLLFSKKSKKASRLYVNQPQSSQLYKELSELDDPD
jgi:hypothetical protein